MTTKRFAFSSFLPLLLLAACGGPAPEPKTAAKSAEPVPIEVESLELTERAEVYEAVGTVRARNVAQISSRIPAYIRQVHANLGDQVRAGQTLVELDDRDLIANLERAQAARTEVQGAMQEAGYGLAAAEADMALAKVTHERFEGLLGKKSVSRHEYDQIDARLKAAQAGVEMALARRRQAGAKLEQVEAEIRAAEVVRGYATIQAPFAGFVTERRMDAGSLAAPGMPILVIDQQGQHHLEANVPEARAAALRAGQRVTVRLDALNEEVQGRVTEISPAVDAGSRTVIVKIPLPPHRSLRSGMFGRARFAAGDRQVLTVPLQAVIERGQMQSVFVVEDNVARRRLVSLGAPADGRYQVLAGLHAEEKVIVNPGAIADGASVRVERVVPRPGPPSNETSANTPEARS